MKNKILISAAISLFAATAFAQTSDQQTAPPSAKRTKKAQRTVAQTPEEPISSQNSQTERHPEPNRVRGMALAGYSISNKAKFDKVSFSSGGNSVSGTYEASVDSAFYVGGGAIYTPNNAFGYSASLVFEMKREISSVVISSGGNSTTNTYTSKPSLQFIYVEANALYRMDQFYVPFGINYSMPTFTQSPESNGTFNIKGALGWQIGLAFIANENLHLSALWRVTSGEASGSYPSIPLDVNFGTGNLGGLAFQANYLF
jgi:hypothetical protein